MVTVKCASCGKEFSVGEYRLKRTKQICCSTECLNALKSKLKYDEISNRIGEDFREYLLREYVVKKRTCRQIALDVYGTQKSSSCISRWLHRLDIEIRHGSEAIKTQWINNDSRRKQASEKMFETMTPELRKRINATMQTPEYREKQSISKLGSKNGMYGVTGSQHPQWNPNRTHDQRVKERKTTLDSRWRKTVLKRDNFICQCCGYDKGHILVAHHLNSYDTHEEDRYSVDNGITLCETCHKAFHRLYGYGNNTKEQYYDFKTNTCPRRH